MRRAIAVCLVLLALPAYAADEVRKGGANDLSFATPNQGSETTWVSPGGRTVTYIDAAHIPWRSMTGYVDDLASGAQYHEIKAFHVSGPTKSFNATLKEPTASDAPFLFQAVRNMTVQRISCVTTAGSVSIQIQECDSSATNCTGIDASSISCSTTPTVDTNITVNNSIDANDWIKVTYSAPSSVGFATISVQYTD